MFRFGLGLGWDWVEVGLGLGWVGLGLGWGWVGVGLGLGWVPALAMVNFYETSWKPTLSLRAWAWVPYFSNLTFSLLFGLGFGI